MYLPTHDCKTHLAQEHFGSKWLKTLTASFPKKKGRKGCNVVGSRPVWAKLPTLGLGEKMGKMGLVTRWLKTNFGKNFQIGAVGQGKSRKELGRDGWDWAGCDQG